MLPSLSLLALGLAAGANAQTAGSFSEKGDTLVSAMMVCFPDWRAHRCTEEYLDVHRKRRKGLHSRQGRRQPNTNQHSPRMGFRMVRVAWLQSNAR